MKQSSHRRHGLAALWVILWLPALILFACFLINMASLWLARVELENAMEAAALAAVKEWGDQRGGTTATAREVGVRFAGINTIRHQPVVINTNLGPASNNVNENRTCEVGLQPPAGNLIFGAFLDNDPDNTLFSANIKPSCGVGRVLIDTTGQGNLTANNNAWGISFIKTPTTPPNLFIDRVTINLQGGGGEGTFEGSVTLSDSSPPAVVDRSNSNSQDDIRGFSDTTEQIRFSFPSRHLLQIDFRKDDDGPDLGFQPTDRLRFGAGVVDVSRGSGSDDGDGIGRDGVTATIVFRQGTTVLTPVTVTLVNNTHRSNECLDDAATDPINDSLIVHPTRIPDLPCPASSARNNNGQSFAVTQSAPARKFAVRAQARSRVQLPCSWLFGIGKDQVFAKATAVYDCQTGRIRLVRPDRVECEIGR